MNSLKLTLEQYTTKNIEKQSFIKKMYEDNHSILFDYSKYLASTNIKKIEIESNQVIMTSRDRGVRIACAEGDYRIAPIEILNFFDYEKDESDMMENLISDGNNFFDIGANIGWYSINIATAKRNVNVYSFEPIPKTYDCLKNNVYINNIKTIQTYNFAFSKNPGTFTYYYYPEGSGNASAINLSERLDIETVECQVRTLDDFCLENNNTIDFIKCDVEGAELMVFQGGLKIIQRDKPIVFSEILRKWSAKFNYNPNDIFELFNKIGYKAYVVKNSLLYEFELMDENTVDTNFFFLHQQKHQAEINKFVKR